jgi:putative flippase GtrA
MGISYNGRTYAEGKKIGWRDGLRALYCVVRYNAPALPLPMQFLVYLFIGGTAALVNLLLFLMMLSMGIGVTASVLFAFIAAAGVNYLLCVTLLFQRYSRWAGPVEMLVYAVLVVAVALVDMEVTKVLIAGSAPAWFAKLCASAIALSLNFLGRRNLVFSQKPKKARE